jgi:hypothetical protein
MKEKKPKHSGRPRLDPDDLKVTVATRVSPRVLRKLREQADELGIPLSRHLRDLCRSAVKRDKG